MSYAVKYNREINRETSHLSMKQYNGEGVSLRNQIPVPAEQSKLRMLVVSIHRKGLQFTPVVR